MKRRIQEKLAHLTEWEREHLFELIQAEGVEPPERYEMLKQQFMAHLETELVHYHDWMVDDETKLVLRRKFRITCLGRHGIEKYRCGVS